MCVLLNKTVLFLYKYIQKGNLLLRQLLDKSWFNNIINVSLTNQSFWFANSLAFIPGVQNNIAVHFNSSDDIYTRSTERHCSAH